LLTAADPAELARSLNELPALQRAVQATSYNSYQVAVNPLPHSLALTRLEHVPFLRMTENAHAVEREFGIPVSDAAVVADITQLLSTAVLALAGSGVQVISIEHRGGDPFQWLVGPDGSKLLAIVTPPGGNTESLGFTATVEEMEQRVGSWLSESPLFLSPAYQKSAAVIVNSAPDQELGSVSRAVSEWNSRYAYPRITVGRSDPLVEFIEQTRGAAIPVLRPRPMLAHAVPSGSQLTEMAQAGQRSAEARTSDMLAVFAGLLGSEGSALETVAAEVAAIVPGTLVFNPSPFSRSGVVTMTDGTEQLATNVPGLGYAYFPDSRDPATAAGWSETSSGYDIEGEQLRVTIDRSSGSVASLLQKESMREWVRAEADGLNVTEASRLESISRWRLSQIATRLELQRWSPGRGSLHTTVTVYDGLPWVDIVNDAEAVSGRGMEYRFDFAIDGAEVAWEVPAGSEETSAPVELLEHLRWMRLAGYSDAMLIRCSDAPLASVGPDGSLVSHAPPGRSRYRLATQSRYQNLDEPWMFGWGTSPLHTARVEPRQSARLPTFGNILDIDRVGVAVLGIIPAQSHDGAVVYVQELMGVERRVSIAAGLIRFTRARIVDFLEREQGDWLVPEDGRVLLPIRGRGVSAVLLAGLELNVG
jgi:hypothetical protein